MSSAVATVVATDPVRDVEPPRVRTDRTESRHLAPVPEAVGRAAKGPFIALLTAILGVGLLTLLALNTALAQGSFTAFDVKAENARLADREQQLLQQVGAAESPQALEQQARSLGMVPAENPVFLRLADGKVLGVAVPAAAPVKPKPAPKPAAKPAAEKKKPAATAKKPSTSSTPPKKAAATKGTRP